MTKEYLFNKLKEYFKELVVNNSLNSDNIKIRSKTLKAEEAIGITERKDFPIIVGKEIMLQAEFQGAYGQAFTDAPSIFEGTLEDIMNLDIINDPHSRGIFIASMNAVMSKLGLVKNTVHCKNSEPELCAKKIAEYIREIYSGKKIALIGYQPAILDALSKDNNIRILDLNKDNIGENKYGVIVEDGIKAYDEVVLNWAEVILCTGSTLCNGSIVNFIDIEKEVIFYGTTVAGAAKVFNLKRICFYSI
ncbi:Domain of uncharacterised function (DUF364) [uncultured Clostridium sp.]|uniref:Rossmann-like domain-containing protein n=1 Tax=uncultured Clostridium sp. TaxID=59620 RepID=UPI0008224F0D|nr:DUF364 domain-containing protein [uncultured Clostridium sp.]SCK04604.1 Domain of uncharacterised function (DUF364) [uncultured Clostridium sp.]